MRPKSIRERRPQWLSELRIDRIRWMGFPFPRLFQWFESFKYELWCDKWTIQLHSQFDSYIRILCVCSYYLTLSPVSSLTFIMAKSKQLEHHAAYKKLGKPIRTISIFYVHILCNLHGSLWFGPCLHVSSNLWINQTIGTLEERGGSEHWS